MIKEITSIEKLAIVRLVADGWSYSDVAREYGLTPYQVREIIEDYYG